jgi:hypothetical protein
VDDARWLARLRAEFPYVGFVHTPVGRWVAVVGKDWHESAPTAYELRDLLRGAVVPRLPDTSAIRRVIL